MLKIMYLHYQVRNIVTSTYDTKYLLGQFYRLFTVNKILVINTPSLQINLNYRTKTINTHSRINIKPKNSFSDTQLVLRLFKRTESRRRVT